jgi:hypothetical protein
VAGGGDAAARLKIETLAFLLRALILPAQPYYPVKTNVSRVVPLLACIALCSALSWVSIYAFWFAVRVFHSVPVMRACDAAGHFFLMPANWICEEVGGDQTTVLFFPMLYAITNGLIWGVALYCAVRTAWKGLVKGKGTALNGARQHPAKVN